MGLYDYEWFKSGFLSMSGIDLNSYKEGQMKRRIDNFLKKHQVDDYNTFLSLLKQDTEIYDSFITYLTINVSEFYRNPLQWQTLEKLAGCVENNGFEPLTLCVQSRCSSQLS